MLYDALIVGAGPSGLSAALTLGRACKRVLLCDAGPRRNAAAERVHNFVTRDGTPPDDFRRVAREQLASYPDIEVRDASVDSIRGAKGAFEAVVGGDRVTARRILLGTGMVDEMLPLPGFRELWGRSIFQCPYCHGWEVKGRPWAYLARADSTAHLVPFVLQLRGWTDDVMVFTDGGLDLPEASCIALADAGVPFEPSPVTGLLAQADRLQAVALADGRRVSRDVLFAHPPQRQTDLARALGLAVDDDGFLQVDPMTRQTSLPGVYASGDATTRMQAAIAAAASGTHAAAMINLDLSLDR